MSLRSALTDFVEDRYRGAAGTLKGIHALRRGYFGDMSPIETPGIREQRPVETLDTAASASAPPDQGRLLFHLARTFQPARALELGTNIGISAAYMAVGLVYGGGRSLTTIELSDHRLAVARSNFEELGLANIETIRGRFDDVLPEILGRPRAFEMAFIDGNHRKDATLRYVRLLHQHMAPDSLMVLDDIRWSQGMWEAWQEIGSSALAAHTVDLGRTGLLVTA
ncbi:MAG: class I SAM-dependent methyltransferase [Acidimicrobiia bacterium]